MPRLRLSARFSVFLGSGLILLGVPIWVIAAALLVDPVERSLGVIIGGALVAAGIIAIAAFH